MGKRYKLCRVYERQDLKVQPINENGEDYGDTLLTMEGDDWGYYYAIYENLNYNPDDPDNDNDEDWDEWHYYDQDFQTALAKYKELTGE